MTDTGYRFIAVDYNPFDGPEIESIAPSTEPQKEIFVSTLIGEADASRAYNESFSLVFAGNLDQAAFHQAFTDLVVRHESLRSTISTDGKKIIVFKTSDFNLIDEDITTLETDDQNKWLNDLADQLADTYFDVSKGPLFRAYLIKINSSSWQFTLVGHHIVSDGWSQGILLQDLGKLYNAHTHKTIATLTAATQFSTYAREQNQFEKTSEYNTVKQFWINQLKDNIPAFDFPTDFVRPSIRTYKSERNDYPVDAELSKKIKQLGVKNGSSFITTLIAAFEVFLHKASSLDDVIFALPTAGQSVTGSTHLIGHCVNMLPIRSTINPSLDFATYLQTRKSQILDCYEHQRLTFGALLKEIDVPRDRSKVTLLPVSFNVDLGMTNDVAFDGLSFKLINNPRHYETFDFFLNASGTESEMVFEWSYNTNLFKAETIKKLHVFFEQILETITANPTIQINEIPSPNTAEENLAYEALNSTYKSYPSYKTVDQLVSDAALLFPTSVAVNFEGIKLQYQQLEKRANQVSNYLVKKGIGLGDTVGLAIDRSINLPVVFLGVSKAGAAFQPVDPAYPAQRINYILQDGAAKLLITSVAYKNSFETNIETIFIEDLLSNLDAYSDKPPTILRSSSDLIYILHTSGSTGQPKGVLIEHRNVVNLLLSMQQAPGLHTGDKLMSFTSIAFDIFYLELFLPLITGATLVMINSDASKDAREIIECIKQEKITVVQTTPSVWNSIVELTGNATLNVKAISGGEALPKELARKMLGKVTELWNVYGPTETTIWATAKKLSPADEVITIGRPTFNTSLYVLDEKRNLVKPGRTGELFVSGENVGRGYLNLPELTAKKFIQDTVSLSPGQRMYQTGDLARLLDNGEIQCLGRADQQLKINGFRIEPEEIEQCILLANKHVQQVVVKPIKTAKNISLLAAYYTLAPNGEMLGTLTWKQRLKERLPNYMIPDYYVLLEKFPLTPNDKIDRSKLQLPDAVNSSVQTRTYTITEKIVMAIWNSALENQEIGLDDDFFDMGGHSLIAAQVMQQIEESTGKKLPLTTLFESATVRTLAAAIDSKKTTKTKYKSLVPINTNGSKTPLFLVHGAGLNVLMFYPLAKYLDEHQPLYGLQALGLDGLKIEPDTIEAFAHLYNKEIVEAVPNDEYVIIGYSLGGIIAFEMAKQLTAMGKKVKLLGVIDTYIDNEDYHLSKLSRYTTKLLRQPKKLGFIAKSLLSNPSETMVYQAYISKEKLKNLFNKVVPEEKSPSAEEQINDHYEQAYTKYQLTAYNNEIYLFKVSKRLYYVDDPTYLGWKPYAPKGVVVTSIPGDHKTFLLPPHDKTFAQIIQKTLNSLDTNK